MVGMDQIIVQLTTLSGISIVVERTTQLVKTGYLQLKNAAFKKNDPDISAFEKEILAIIVGIATCFTVGFGINLPNVVTPVFASYVLAGVIVSLGSNVIHALVTILITVKNNLEVPGIVVDPAPVVAAPKVISTPIVKTVPVVTPTVTIVPLTTISTISPATESITPGD